MSHVSTAADHDRAAAPAAPPLPPPRGPAPAEATRERLLQATHELLSERGGGTVSVSEISERANANVAMVKYCFGNKDGLIRISQGVHAYLKEKDVPHVWNVDGHAHDPTEWRNNLYYFLQRVFR